MARHAFACPMRWSDMDAYGHVNNVVFLRYLEEARIDLLLTAAGPAGRAMLDDGIVVVRHEIDYRKPLVHRVEPVPILSWVDQNGKAAFSLARSRPSPWVCRPRALFKLRRTSARANCPVSNSS